MFTVSTVNLSSDASAASHDFDVNELGEISAAELVALLERLRRIDAVQNTDADPHLLVAARTGRFLIRTGQGKLFLYDARDITAPYAELTAEQIVAQLARAPVGPAQPDTPDEAVTAKSATPHRGIAVAIFVAGLALNGYTLYTAFYSESVNVKMPVTLLTDPAEIAAQAQAVAGTYATGAQPGDRVIAVGADGRVAFSEIGNARSINNGSDTFRLGRHDKKLCLTTPENGVIDIVNIDTLLYYRDTYKRR